MEIFEGAGSLAGRAYPIRVRVMPSLRPLLMPPSPSPGTDRTPSPASAPRDDDRLRHRIPRGKGPRGRSAIEVPHVRLSTARRSARPRRTSIVCGRSNWSTANSRPGAQCFPTPCPPCQTVVPTQRRADRDLPSCPSALCVRCPWHRPPCPSTSCSTWAGSAPAPKRPHKPAPDIGKPTTTDPPIQAPFLPHWWRLRAAGPPTKRCPPSRSPLNMQRILARRTGTCISDRTQETRAIGPVPWRPCHPLPAISRERFPGGRRSYAPRGW